jgi:DNA repair exonuclease SbcCD ATPase subunit
VSSLSDNQLTAYVHDGAVKPELEAELRQVLAKKLAVFNVDQDLKSVRQEMESIDKDQSRLRENMKALKGSPEERALLQRYTKQLDGQEDRLATLRGLAADLKTKHNQLQSELDAMVMKLAIDDPVRAAICERGTKSYATHRVALPYGVTQDPSLWRWSPAYED